MSRFITSGLLIWTIIVYHVIAGIGVLIEPTVRNVTGLAAVYGVFGNYDYVVYFMISFVAIVGEVVKYKYIIGLTIFQQILLFISTTGELVAISNGTYPDGYLPKGGSIFILIDQTPTLLLCILHVIAMIDK